MPRLLEVTVFGESAPRDVVVGADDRTVDARGLVLLPSLVDLGCDPGFPGFPAREDLASLTAAALSGGFGDLVTSPLVDPVVDTPEHIAAAPRQGPGGLRLWPAGAVTRGLCGEELAEIGLMGAAGAVALSDGGRPIRDTVVLRNVLEYARGFGLRVFLRAADADLDVLGVIHESGVAAQLGMRGNPAAAEEIGIARVVALVRTTGATVHLTRVGTARGVEAVRVARAEGLPLTASTPARNLLLDEAEHFARPYDTRLRLHPPLRGPADRAALIAGVRDGTLLLTSDHSPRAPEEKDLEFELSTPGSSGLESAFSAALTALDGDLSAVVAAFCTGPRALLPERPGGCVLVDPNAYTVVDAALHHSRARNDALDGHRLRGQVRACFPAASIPWVGPGAEGS
ncbi:MAG: dihydroorotase [Myxococcota bacterium]